MTKRLFIFFALLLVGSVAFSQSSAIKKGNKKSKKGEYNVAIAYYQKALSDSEYKGESNFYIAEAYRMSNRLSIAGSYYEAAINNRYNDPKALFYYAFSLKVNGKYDEAETQLRRFLEIGEDEYLLKWAQKELDQLSYLVVLEEKKNFYRVRNLEIINTSNAEYSPVYNNGELFFTSNRQNSKIYKATGTAFTDIYKATESDFQKATQRIYRNSKAPSHIRLRILSQ